MKFIKSLNKLSISMFVFFFSHLVIAADDPADGGLGGIEKASETIDSISATVYTIVGSLASLYVLAYVIMAFMDKKTWQDVMIALGKVAAAGGVLLLVDFAWSIWGS